MAGEFSVHRLNDNGLALADTVAVKFFELLASLDGLGIVGRERALVVTKLQEACFWAKRAVAMDPRNQQ